MRMWSRHPSQDPQETRNRPEAAHFLGYPMKMPQISWELSKLEAMAGLHAFSEPDPEIWTEVSASSSLKVKLNSPPDPSSRLSRRSRSACIGNPPLSIDRK